MNTEISTETLGMPVQLARMEGKLDQVIVDHERRLGETSQTLNVLANTVTTQGNLLATHTANISAHTKEIADLEIRSTGALGKVMTVVSPIIAAGALITAIVFGGR